MTRIVTTMVTPTSSRSELRRARLYLVAPARIATGDLADAVPDLARAGVDIIQLREKEMEAGDLVRAGRPVAKACREAGIVFIVNDRPDVAVALDADGVHLGQNDLPIDVARGLLEKAIIGGSTHTPAQVSTASHPASKLDYFAVGPVFETPTKPGRPAAGLSLVQFAAARAQLPWFAIGGINEKNLDEIMAAGARRVVVVRAITEAPDPPAAAHDLRRALDAAPL